MGSSALLFVLLGLLAAGAPIPWKTHFAPRAADEDHILEVLVPPPVLAAPFDVSVGLEGIAAVEVRRDRILGFTPGGDPVELGRGLRGMYFDHDGTGRLYAYSFPSGEVRSLDRATGRVKVWPKLPQGHRGGSLAVTASGSRVYALKFNDMGKAVELFVLRPEAKAFRRVDCRGRFVKAVDGRGEEVYAVTDAAVYRIEDRSLHRVLRFRDACRISPGGFCAGPDGGFFIVQPDGKSARLCYVDARGSLKLLRRTEPGVVPSGIDYDTARGLLWFVCKEKGLAAHLDAKRWLGAGGEGRPKAVTVSAARGVITPIAVGVAPDGALYVNGDEVGVYAFSPEYLPRVLYRGICCYQPPPADFVAERGKRLVYTAAAPGFPGEVLLLSPRANPRSLTCALKLPAGIARLGRGKYLVADYGTGRIHSVTIDGRVKTLGEGFRFPFGIALGDDGSWFVTCSRPDRLGDPASVMPLYPEILVRRRPGGTRETLFDVRQAGCGGSLFFLDRLPGGRIVFAAGGTVRLYDPASGGVTLLASGFQRAAGIAADARGRVYVTDYDAHALVRITPRR